MTTAVALGLMLAFEPREPDIMTRPPRNPDQPLLTRALVARTLLVSALLVAGSWWLFEWELAHGAGLAEARTAAMNLFVVVEAFYLYSCLPTMNTVFDTAPIDGRAWLRIVAIALAASLVVAIDKRLRRVSGSTDER